MLGGKFKFDHHVKKVEITSQRGFSSSKVQVLT